MSTEHIQAVYTAVSTIHGEYRELSLQEAKDYLWEKCYGSISELRNHSSFPEYENQQELLNLMRSLPIKASHDPEMNLQMVDFVLILGGQAATLAKNCVTYHQLLKKGLSKEITLYVNQIVPYMFPSRDQESLARDYVHNNTSHTLTHRPKIAENFFFECRRHNIKFLPWKNARGNAERLQEIMSMDFPDRPLDIIVISTQPEQVAEDIKIVCPRSPHNIQQAYLPHESESEFLAKYWGNSEDQELRFLLLDYVKIFCRPN